jgi:hypothetical protein
MSFAVHVTCIAAGPLFLGERLAHRAADEVAIPRGIPPMIRILLVDFESLIDLSGGACPGASAALGALSLLETFEGERLLLVTAVCGEAPAQAATRVAALGFSGLLSPAAAVWLPLGGGAAERSALAAALQPILPGVRVDACAAALKDEERVLSCRGLGIPALAPGFDKMEWRDVPLLVARLMDPSNLRNLGCALGPYLPEGVEDVSVVAAEPKRMVGRAKRYSPVAKGSGSLLPDGLCVPVPIELSVQIEPEGARVESFSVGVPSQADVAEATAAAEDLFARGEVALEPDLVNPATTHFLERRDGGRRLLRRVRRSVG